MSEKAIENHIDKIILQENINQLNEQDRQIIILYYWWGYRDSEIGEIMSLSQQLVNYRRNKAIKQFREHVLKSDAC